MKESHPFIEVRGLTRVFGDGNGVRALDGVDLAIDAGEFASIVGPSGSGKSTLLHLLGALDRPTSGEILFDGRSLSRTRDLDHFRSRCVGFVFQLHNLLPTLTALENVEVPMAGVIHLPWERRRRAHELLALVGLEKRADFLPAKLSGGERQRAAIARALANRPPLILADEPTGSLDTQLTAEIMDLLMRINAEQGVTILAVTHNHEVASRTQRVITLRDGRIESDVRLRDPFDRDLHDFKESPLGRAIRAGECVPDDVQPIAAQLREIFARV
jgi:putative ABC transport system ATP-binding protein